MHFNLYLFIYLFNTYIEILILTNLNKKSYGGIESESIPTFSLIFNLLLACRFINLIMFLLKL